MKIVDNFELDEKEVDLYFGVEDVQLYPSDYQISVEDIINDMSCDIIEIETFGLEDLNIKEKAKAAFEWILKQLKRLVNFFKALWNKMFNKEKKIEKTIKEIKTEIKISGSSASSASKQSKPEEPATQKEEDNEDKFIKHGGVVKVIKADTKTPDTIIKRLKKCDTTLSVASNILSATANAIDHIKTLTVSNNGKEYIEEILHTIGRLNSTIEDNLDTVEQLNYTKHFDINTLGGSVKCIDKMFTAVVQINLGFKECSKELDNTLAKVNAVASKRGIEGAFDGEFINANASAIGSLSNHLYKQVIMAFNDLDTCALSIRSYVKKLGGNRLESNESVNSVNKIVESIMEEYGIEGVTSIIRNLTSK